MIHQSWARSSKIGTSCSCGIQPDLSSSLFSSLLFPRRLSEIHGQAILESAHQTQNLERFQQLLRENPSLTIGDGVRSYALEGGAKILEAILARDLNLINRDFAGKVFHLNDSHSEQYLSPVFLCGKRSWSE